MNQTVYILVLLSLVFLFLINKYEREKLQRILQEQLLKDEEFKTSIKEKIRTTENMNDVIDYINKTYRLGLLLAKEITDPHTKYKIIKRTTKKQPGCFLFVFAEYCTDPASFSLKMIQVFNNASYLFDIS